MNSGWPGHMLCDIKSRRNHISGVMLLRILYSKLFFQYQEMTNHPIQTFSSFSYF